MAVNGFPIEFAVTPRFDLFYALYTLTNPAATRLGPWKERALTRLPRDFERVAKRVAPVPLFWPLLADALQSVPGDLSFEEILRSLRALAPSDLKANILSGIFHDRTLVEGLLSRRKTLRQVLTDDDVPNQTLLSQFGLHPYTAGSHAANAIGTLLNDASVYRDEVAIVLERFWQTGFKRDWALLEPAMRADAFRLKELHEQKSLPEFTRSISLPVTIDDTNRRVLSSRGSAVADFDKIDRLYVIPSGFNAGRWWAKYEGSSRRVRLYFPLASPEISPNTIVEEKSRPPQVAPRRNTAAVNAEQVFRALGDTTRYAIASILARTPTTSADLARRLNVSKPTITHHIQALRSAGLILGDTQGGATRLSLNADTIRAVSDAAVEQLFAERGDRVLSTTRKRQK